MTETTGPKHPTWQAALSAAQAEVESPAKDGRNTHHGFDYTTAEAMIGATKAPLGKHGLAARLGDFETQYKKVDGQVWPVKATFWLDWEGGESIASTFTYPAIEGNGRPADKAIAGALTTMTGYWLRGLLNIPRGIDGGISGRDDTAYEGGGHRAPRPKGNRHNGGGGVSQARPDYSRGIARPQDQPLEAAVFGELRALLTREFGDPREPDVFARVDGLAFDVCAAGIKDVMQDQTAARKLLTAVQASQ